MTSSPLRGFLDIIVAAVTEGTTEAARRAALSTQAGQERQDVLAEAAMLLMQARRYTESTELLREAARQGTSSAAEARSMAEFVARARRHEELEFEEGPTGFVKNFMVTASMGSDPEGWVASHLAGSLRAASADEVDFAKGFRLGITRGRLAAANAQMDASIEMLLDLGLAGMDLTADGNPEVGHRVRVRSLVPGYGWDATYYLTREEKGLRLLAVAPFVTPLGHEALRLLEAGEVEGARVWLDWAAEAMSDVGSDDPLQIPPFRRLWSANLPSDPDTMRYAAAALMAMGEGARHSVEILTEGLEKAETTEERFSFEHALASSYIQQERWSDLRPIATRIFEFQPQSLGAFVMTTIALTKTKQWDDVKRLVEERLAEKPQDPIALRAIVAMADERGEFREAEQALRRIVEQNKALPADYNNLAWYILEQDAVTEETVGFAERAALFNNQPDAAGMHTLASIYAEVGRYSEARELILQEMAMRGVEEPGPLEWYVFGRISEGYGEIEAARSFYELVRPRDAEGEETESTYRLAQQRIAALSEQPRRE
jgi:tetratricopeptide (TPR) repeat protein